MSSYFKLGTLIEGITTTVTTNGTTLLTASSRTKQQFTGTSDQILKLPDATTLSVGRRFEVLNRSAGAISVIDDGSNLVAIVSAGVQKKFKFADISTSNGQVVVITPGGDAGFSAGSLETRKEILSGVASGFRYQSPFLVSKPISFDPEHVGAAAWLGKTPLPGARFSNAGFELHGYGYSAGGNDGSVFINSVDRYDIDNDYWLSKPGLPAIRGQAAAFSVNDFGFVVGGFDGSSSFATTFKYDDMLDSWSTVQALGAARNSPAGCASPDFGYVFGGSIGGSTSNDVERYDTEGDFWLYRSDLITTREACGATPLNKELYVFGGLTTGGTNTATSERYDEPLDSWRSVKSLSSAVRWRASATATTGFAYVVGGADNSSVSQSSVDRYSDFADFYTAMSEIATATQQQGSFVVKQRGYIFGGYTTSQVATMSVLRDASPLFLGCFKKTRRTPLRVIVGVATKNRVLSVPVQIRTDGNNWKSLESNSDSALSSGELFRTKFLEAGYGEYAGGSNGSALDTTELYDAGNDVWTVKSVAPAARVHSYGFTANGYSYLLGGEDAAGTTGYTTNYRFDESADSYVTKQALGTAKRDGAAFSLRQIGYIAGGRTGSAAATAISAVEQYEPASDAWTTKTSLPVALYAPASSVLHEQGLVIAGADTGGTALSSSYSYNALADAWTTKDTLATARISPMSFSLGNFAYAIGGANGPLATVEKYDAESDSWSAADSLATARGRTQGFIQEGYGFVAGGYNGAALQDTERYNASADAWTAGSNLSEAKYDVGSGTPGFFRKYEIKVGLSGFFAGAGSRTWVTKTAPPAVANTMAFDSGAHSYVIPSFGTQFQKYELANDFWTIKSTTTIAFYAYRTTWSLQGFGFTGFANGASSSLERYDFESETPVSRTSSTGGHGIGGGFALDHFGYICGGDNPTINAGVEKYNPATDSYTTVTSMASARELGSGCGGARGYGFVIGGISGSPSNTIEKYDPLTDSWVAATNFPVSTLYSTGLGFDGFLYSIGGSNGTSEQAYVYKYDLDKEVWITENPMNTAANTGGASFYGNDIFMLGGNPSHGTESYVDSMKDLNLGVSLEVDE